MNGEDRTELSALRAEVRQLAAETRSVGAKVDVVSTKVDASNASITDHETRLRKVEAWRQALPVSTLIFLGTTAIALVGLFIKS